MATSRNENATKKARKAYPTLEERLSASENTIARLEKLISERANLIRETEQKLVDRRAALKRSQDDLDAAKAKHERILAAMNKPKKTAPQKLSPEERSERRKAALAKAREAKKLEKEKLEALRNALEARGKSVDDLLAELNKED